MTDSYIQSSPGGAISFVGPDAVEIFRVIALKSALGLLKAGITPTRGFTAKYGLGLVTAITQKTYKGADKFDKARADLETWLTAARASIPVEYAD